MYVEQSSAKAEVLEKLLERGMVLVTLDARMEGVDVPEHLRADPQLRLNLSYRFGLPMHLGEDEVSATLTFGGVPYQCRLPWGCLYMFISHASGEPYLFPADIPEEAAAAILALESAMPPLQRRPNLRVVSPDGEAVPEGETTEEADSTPETMGTTPDGDEPPPPPEPPRAPKGSRSHLRVVK